MRNSRAIPTRSIVPATVGEAAGPVVIAMSPHAHPKVVFIIESANELWTSFPVNASYQVDVRVNVVLFELADVHNFPQTKMAVKSAFLLVPYNPSTGLQDCWL